MPSIINADKIGTLSYSAPNVTLGPSLVTVGGQQYRTLTSLTANTGTLTANTLYCVYVVISGGAPQLVVSTNVNSAGPAGHTRWKLVGSFLTGLSSTFQLFLATDTLNPSIAFSSGKSSPFAYVNNAFAILSNWNTSGLDFFDLPNGYIRLPFAAVWEVQYKLTFDNLNSGTANTMNSNVYSLIGYKNTVPANPSDFTENINDLNTQWYVSLEPTCLVGGLVSTSVANSYIWFASASNLFSLGAQVLSAKATVSLRYLSKKIEDL